MKRLLLACFVVVVAAAAVYVYILLQTRPVASLESLANKNEEISSTTIATKTNPDNALVENKSFPVIKLNPTQRNMAESLGYQIDEIVLNQATLACSEEAVGADRVADFVAGATPGVFELVKLTACLK